MKISRQKHVRRVLVFYRNNFGFTPPFKILIDGTFCRAALKFKVNIAEQLPKYMSAEVKLCTTPCAKLECEAMGTLLYGPLKVLRQYEEIPCQHNPPVPAGRCLWRLAKKKENKYFLATQDQELSDKVRSRAGMPLLYISHNAVTLENPSDVSRQTANQTLEKKIAPSEQEHSTLKTMKKEVFGEEATVTRKKKKKKGGPNPLSCKKKKKKPAVENGGVSKRKRQRKKNKVPNGVKQELKSLCSSV